MKHARMLRNSILDNKNKMAADKTIKYDAAKSVLKYKIGDAIRLNEEAFVTLFKAFFAEIEARFPDDRALASVSGKQSLDTFDQLGHSVGFGKNGVNAQSGGQRRADVFTVHRE